MCYNVHDTCYNFQMNIKYNVCGISSGDVTSTVVYRHICYLRLYDSSSETMFELFIYDNCAMDIYTTLIHSRANTKLVQCWANINLISILIRTSIRISDFLTLLYRNKNSLGFFLQIIEIYFVAVLLNDRKWQLSASSFNVMPVTNEVLLYRIQSRLQNWRPFWYSRTCYEQPLLWAASLL